jgi:hypothetical protein
MPRSPVAFRTSDLRSVLGNACENPLLIKRHRMLKSLSPGGKVHPQFKCSGKKTRRQFDKVVFTNSPHRFAQQGDFADK